MKPLLSIALGFSLAVSASAQLPDGLMFDDGFTWFTCHNFEVYDNNVAAGKWVPEFNFRILGATPANSGFKVVLEQNGKELYTTSLDGYATNVNGLPGTLIVGFWKDKDRIAASGMIDAKVYYIDGQTNKEYLAKTLKIDVRKANNVRGGPGSREAGPTAFYVNRHSEVLSNILYFREVGYPSYTQMSNLDWFEERRVELLLNYAENENFNNPGQGRLIVEVNGKILDMMVPNNTMAQDKLGFGQDAGRFNVMWSDRDADKYFKQGTAYQERVGFARRSFILPFEWGPPIKFKNQGFPNASNFPGDWKVTYMVGRETVRIFKFKVGVDGLPVPHDEQKNGLNLAPNAILVDTEIPGKGGDFDGRLTNEFVSKGGFFGRAWTSAAMKAAATAVPMKGRPFPVSSAKQ